MSVETDLKTTLGNAAGVSALVGNRVYPNIAQKGAALPYIVYSRSDTEKFSSLTGTNDPANARIEIGCTGSTYSSAKAVADAVIAALQGDGYQQSEYDLYDDATERHSIFIGWSFAE